MLTWLLDELWNDQNMSRFIAPMAPIVYGNNNSSMNAFMDYMWPASDRLSSLLNDDNLLDYYNYYSDRPLRIKSSPNKHLKTFKNEYQLLNCVGQGGFGQVYDGRRKIDNASVVIKLLPRDRILNWGTFEGKRVPYEIEILYRLRDVAGVIRIIDHFEEPDRFIFTMKKIPNSMTLFSFVMNNSSLANTELLKHIFRELVQINIILQNYGVWHRDCKAENILICKNDRSLRFIDFGSAAPVQSEDFHEFQGTLEIMVPEWILQKRYNGERACVWSLGVCLYFLLFQQYPFRSKPEIIKGRSHLPFSSSTDKAAYQTMRQCLNGNEYGRPKLTSLQHLSWLK